ncbi:MAG: EAL domain-containing protein [Clostridia bacterium]|nr:EAL domain-containing protein [Clostridia bacterium]
MSDERRKILLVEDEIINQELMKESLSGIYDLIVTETGEEAMDVVNEQHQTLSVVILDLNLPGISGIEVLKRIKESPVLSQLPVIVMTSDDNAEVECLTLGAIDFIPKPYPATEVIRARIRRIIELSENRDILRFTERDHLTGLYNKEFFYRYVAQLDLYNSDAPADAIIFDINHFRMINERYGKDKGDKILKLVAQKALAIENEAGGIFCRSGPDTFMYYCPHLSDYESVLESLSVSVSDGERDENRIRMRMGVYSDVDKTLDIERRFDCAKMASDAVKGNLTHPIGFYDRSMRESEILAEQLIDDFRDAIREKQFAVFYQPKFNIRPDNPVLCSAEALVRWKHPKLGMISPGVFIPLFEENGLIEQLDHYVWSQAARQITVWKEKLNISLPVSVNVSRIDLYDPELESKLLKIAEEEHLNSGELMLEITESAYSEDQDQIVKKVTRLRELGFKIEMDDFGSGYSSLSMLSYMPIDALKLDMQFIRSAFKGRMDTRLLEAMIRIAEAFEVPTIAEGVETEEQVTALKRMGCDIIQGYYFSRPLPADEFEAFVREKTK